MSNLEHRRKMLQDGIREEFGWAASYEKQIDSHLDSIERLRSARKECFKNMQELQGQLDKLEGAQS